MKKAGLLLLIALMAKGLLAQGPTYGQRFEQTIGILPSAPNASAITKYGGIQVNLSKGVATHAVPLYELKIPGASVPVGLSYAGNGLKVDEYASRVGFNWSLEAGGVISRTVYGHPDEGSQRLEMPSVGPVIDTAYYNFLIKATGGANYDAQPDLFTYSFGGMSGKFVLDKNKVPVTLDGSPIKIETNFSSSDWNFRITGLDGTQYVFGGNTATEETRTESTCGKPYTTYLPTSWYLKKIVAINGREIIFNYTSIEFNFSTGYSVTNYSDATPNRQCPDTTSAAAIYCASYASQATTCEGIFRSRGRYLTSIVCTGIGRVDFQSISSRNDCNDILYTGLTAKDAAGRLVTQYQFEYQTGGDNRPFLKKVRRLPVNTGSPEITQFVYNPGTLPPMHSFNQDHYGFYNGSGNNTLIPLPETYTLEERFPGATADREPNPAYAAIGMLSKIIYPTGGSDTILYEGNDFSDYKRILPPKATFGISAIGTGFKQTATTVSSPFTISYEQEVRLTMYIELLNSSTGNFDPVHDRGTVILKDSYGNELYYYNDNPTQYRRQKLLLGPGTYLLEVRGTGLGIKGELNIECRPGLSTMDSVNTITAGVRVRKVITATHATDAAPQVKMYQYRQPSNPLRSSGGEQPVPEYLHYFQNRQYCNQGVVSYLYCDYSGMYSSSRLPVLLYDGGVAYAAVTERFGENGENGKIEHYYHIGSLSQASQAGMGEGSFVGAPLINSSPMSGKEKLSLLYKKVGSNFVLLKKTDYIYKNDLRGFKIIEAVAVNKKFENHIVQTFLSLQDFEGFDVARYSSIANWIYLDSLKEVNYMDNGLPSLETYVAYRYDSSTHRQLTSTTTKNSDGKLVITTSKYPGDFAGITGTDALSSSVKNLQNRNVIGAQVETAAYVASGDGSNKVLTGARLAVYDNDSLHLREVWQPEFATPLTNFTPLTVTSGALVKDSRYKQQVTFSHYDTKGNILQQQKVGDIPRSYVWGYDQSMPIAEAINAKGNEIFFDGFEDKTGWDNWELTYDESIAHSGRVSAKITAPVGAERVNLATDWLNISLSAPKKFKYSGWYFSNGPSVDLFLFMKTATETGYFSVVDAVAATQTGKWVYIEKEFEVPANITRLNIRLDNNGGGTVWFDDVRLHPAEAQMTSYTHDPLVGITSMTDINNRSTFYEYDAFGRLSIVRDKDRNVLKKICYNLSGQQEACGILSYQNAAASGTFQRNNCGTNGTGGSYTYSVAAGTYTSYISQADADQQAVNDVNTNGPGLANSTAGCTWINQVQTVTYQRNNCGTNGTGASASYTVNSGSYSSTTSLSDANQQALNAANAAGQAHANSNAGCTWVNQQQSSVITRNDCGTNGTGSSLIYYVYNGTFSSTTSLADANQQALNHIATYGQSYVNANAGCTWINQPQSGTFTKECPTNYAGSSVTYTIAQGTYSSTTSLAHANTLATNAVNSGGQAYANANGTCTFICNTSNCTGQGKKCVNNTCETGVKVYTFCEQVTHSQRRHYYHYEFSDGSWSQTYTELNSNPCEE